MGNIFVSPTADQIASGYDLNDKVAIVTGASSGIGLETTRVLAKRGALVCLTCRDVSAGHKAKRNILEKIGERCDEHIRVFRLDLASLQSVKEFAEEFLQLEIPLHYLVLNAAVLGVPYRQTKEGFEMHFGVNYMGHFYLTQALLPHLQKQAMETPRIVAVCCTPPRRASLKLRRLPKGKKQAYNSFKAYDESKLALRYFAEELSLRLWDTNITVVGADPGATYTWLIRNLNPIIISVMAFVSIFMKTPQQGAGTVVFACLDRKVDHKQKPFCSGCRLRKYHFQKARDPALRSDLYEKSLEWMNTAVFDSCTNEAFNPKTEIWKSVSRMVHIFVKQRRRLSNRRIMQGATKYQKLE